MQEQYQREEAMSYDLGYDERPEVTEVRVKSISHNTEVAGTKPGEKKIAHMVEILFEENGRERWAIMEDSKVEDMDGGKQALRAFGSKMWERERGY